MSNYLSRNHENDGVDRRGFLECMAWAGTGLLWSFSGGVARSQMMKHGHSMGGLYFVQISDSHIGFNKDANKDVVGTLREAVARINALPEPPAFLIHTGDISHLSKPEEFDTVEQVLKSANVGQTFFVPGEHDVLTDNGRQYLERFGKSTLGSGWYSFDQKGVHFIALVNVVNLKAGGLGQLGGEQLAWLENDLKGRSGSTPIVVFAHIPLWTVYADWGWGTDDGVRALTLLKRFGSVTILNGHIHQTLQKVEGNFTFHTATSTAFPQPKPGSAPSPGPMKVPSEQLRSLLGLTEVRYVQGKQSLAIVDSSLADSSAKMSQEIGIDNFSFMPVAAMAKVGTPVTWTNHDDIPHNIVAREKQFASPVLDTGDRFTHTFDAPGEYSYYCSIHPKMTGKLVVEA
jgi:plastocyanin